MELKEASFYAKEADGVVRCGLCAHRCRIKPGARDLRRAAQRRRHAAHARLRPRGRGSRRPDREEAAFHFLPGTTSYSIATAGCNFRCRHCQNAEISQMPHDRGAVAGEPLPPAEVVRRALAAGCASISYTYTEPTVFFEYAATPPCSRRPRGCGTSS